MVNTPDCGSGMHGFDPHISPHKELVEPIDLNIEKVNLFNLFMCIKIVD